MNQPFAPFIPCPKCRAVLPQELFNRSDTMECPGCGAPTRIQVFPAFFRAIAVGDAGTSIVSETESSCFYHPQKRAVTPCDGCGRFLCALCDVDFNGQHLCPACLESGKTRGRIKSLQNERVCHDNVALSLAILPLILWPMTLVTAPMAIYTSLRHWNSSCSILPRGKARLIAALVLASLQVVAWALLLYFLLSD